MDPDPAPTPFFIDFKDAKKNFLITFPPGASSSG